jgi:hypothetical protein
MRLRWLAAGSLAAALAGACASAPRGPSSDATPPDPERWEKAACRRGAYPLELDDRALARARWVDLRARRNGEWSPFAVARLEGERDAFDARCATWRAIPPSPEQERGGGAAGLRLAREDRPASP